MKYRLGRAMAQYHNALDSQKTSTFFFECYQEGRYTLPPHAPWEVERATPRSEWITDRVTVTKLQLYSFVEKLANKGVSLKASPDGTLYLYTQRTHYLLHPILNARVPLYVLPVGIPLSATASVRIVSDRLIGRRLTKVDAHST